MLRKNRNLWTTAAAAIVALGVGGAGVAEAGWYSHGSSGGSSGGSWGSSGSSGSSGSWGSHGGWRPFRWLFHRHHHSSGSWGSHGSSGSWGSSGGWHRAAYASHGSSGGSSGGWYGSSGGTAVRTYRMGDETTVEKPVDDSTPPSPPAGEAQPGPALPGETETRLYDPDGDSSMLTVLVPSSAKIFVNDKPTTTPGEARQFVSRNLTPGYRYTYRVRAEWEQDGQLVSRVKTIDLRAGNAARLDFTADANETESVTAEQKADEPADSGATKVTVRLPADAKLYLADRESRQTGETRSFTTTALGEGEVWENYTVRAVAVRNGRTIEREKTITLRRGDSHDLRFDFDAPSLAAADGEAVR